MEVIVLPNDLSAVCVLILQEMQDIRDACAHEPARGTLGH